MKLYVKNSSTGTWTSLDQNGDMPHNPNGPAFVAFNGSRDSYWLNGKRHRIDGPAIITRKEGAPDHLQYYVDGEQCNHPYTYQIKVREYCEKITRKETIAHAKEECPELISLYELNI